MKQKCKQTSNNFVVVFLCTHSWDLQASLRGDYHQGEDPEERWRSLQMSPEGGFWSGGSLHPNNKNGEDAEEAEGEAAGKEG